MAKCTKIKDFEVLSELGHGSFGSVYKVKDEKGKIFAVKELGSKNIKYTENELDLVEEIINKNLKHDNIVEIYKYFIPAIHGVKSVSIVMEFCNGGDLNDYMVANDAPIATRLHFMVAMTRGVCYLHNHYIVHRDLKPENVLLQLKSKLPTCKISDFGISKIKVTRDTNFTTQIGSGAYMAPEIDTQSYSSSVDIYALGMLYFAVFKRTVLQNYFKESSLVPGYKNVQGRIAFLNDDIRKNGLCEKDFVSTYFENDREMGKLIARMLQPNPAKRAEIDEILTVTVMAQEQEKHQEEMEIIEGEMSTMIQRQKKLQQIHKEHLDFVQGMKEELKNLKVKMDLKRDRSLVHQTKTSDSDSDNEKAAEEHIEQDLARPETDELISSIDHIIDKLDQNNTILGNNQASGSSKHLLDETKRSFADKIDKADNTLVVEGSKDENSGQESEEKLVSSGTLQPEGYILIPKKEHWVSSYELLEGDHVECHHAGRILYGKIRWKGATLAGVELDRVIDGGHDGNDAWYGDYFRCPYGRGVYIPLTSCGTDQRVRESMCTIHFEVRGHSAISIIGDVDQLGSWDRDKALSLCYDTDTELWQGSVWLQAETVIPVQWKIRKLHLFTYTTETIDKRELYLEPGKDYKIQACYNVKNETVIQIPS